MHHRGKWAIAIAALSSLAMTGCDGLGETGKAKDTVRRLLKDPDSAQFRDVQPCTKAGAVRGDVNGKNSFGGYTGFKPFIYADGQAAILSDNAGASELELFEQLSGKCYADDILSNIPDPRDADGDVNALSPVLDPPAGT